MSSSKSHASGSRLVGSRGRGGSAGGASSRHLPGLVRQLPAFIHADPSARSTAGSAPLPPTPPSLFKCRWYLEDPQENEPLVRHGRLRCTAHPALLDVAALPLHAHLGPAPARTQSPTPPLPLCPAPSAPLRRHVRSQRTQRGGSNAGPGMRCSLHLGDPAARLPPHSPALLARPMPRTQQRQGCGKNSPWCPPPRPPAC